MTIRLDVRIRRDIAERQREGSGIHRYPKRNDSIGQSCIANRIGRTIQWPSSQEFRGGHTHAVGAGNDPREAIDPVDPIIGLGRGRQYGRSDSVKQLHRDTVESGIRTRVESAIGVDIAEDRTAHRSLGKTKINRVIIDTPEGRECPEHAGSILG